MTRPHRTVPEALQDVLIASICAASAVANRVKAWCDPDRLVCRFSNDTDQSTEETK